MSFDWFTFIAQLVNFGLLLALLRIFLYRPVLNMMDQREERLALAWTEAEEAHAEANAHSRRIDAEVAGLEERRRTRLAEIEAEARELLDRRMAEVEAEASSSRARQLAALEESRERTVQRLRQRTATLLLAELRSSLADLAGDGLEEHAARVFQGRLRELPEGHLHELRKAARESPVELTSAARLTEQQQEELTRVVQEAIGADADLRFSVDEDLLFGTELMAGPMLVAVSGRQRLESLEAEFSKTLADLAKGTSSAAG